MSQITFTLIYFTPQKVTELEPKYSAVQLFCCFNFQVKSGNVHLIFASESKIEICLRPSGNRGVFQSLPLSS